MANPSGLPGQLQNDVPFDLDVLSIDIEGEDVRVLNDLILNSQFRPQWIIIEVVHAGNNSLNDMPFNKSVKQNYTVVDSTESNLILSIIVPNSESA